MVKIYNFDLDIQMDTGSEVTRLYQKELWERIGELFTTPTIW